MEVFTRNYISNDWITIVFVIILLLLAFSKKFFQEDFFDFWRIFKSNKYFTSHKRSLSVFNLFSFLFFIAQGLSISLGIYFLLKTLSLLPADTSDLIIFIQICLAFNIFIGVKYLIEKIIGEIFNISNLLDNYLFYKITYKNFLALAVLPILLILAYSVLYIKIFLFISVGIWIAANMVVLAKYYSQNQKLILGNWFYFILYLCTLEIAPYFILFKVITKVY